MTSGEILDIGCGAGRTTFGLYKEGYTNIVGLDLSKEMIAACEKHKGESQINFIVGDAQKLNFEDNSFDACLFSFNGLMGIPIAQRRENVMKEIFRVLKPSGYFIFTVHDRECYLFRDFWKLQQENWRPIPNKLFEFGDILVPEPKNSDVFSFMHVPSIDEIQNILFNIGFKNIKHKRMSEICQERIEVYRETCDFITALLVNRDEILSNNELIKEAGNLIFWMCQK